jgi:beta-propeller repeat-containing protein
MSIIHSFQSHLSSCDYYEQQSLVQDAAGNLIGIANWNYHWPTCELYQHSAALEYELSPSANGWTYYVLQFVETDRNLYDDYFHGLAVDGTGNSYVAGNSHVIDYCPLDGRMYCHWYLSGGNIGIDYVDQEFSALGLVVDAAGSNLYGVTADCGQYGRGTVWHVVAPPTQKAKPEPTQPSP